MIDFHAHVLPGCDHGSDGIETSMKQLALAKAANLTTVIATPHFYPDRDTIGDFMERRNRTYQLLMSRHSGQPQVLLGAEVALCPGLDHMQGIEKLCIQGTNIILLEMPINYWSHNLEETLVRFQDDSEFVPVLAHVDRYDPARIENLLDYGFLAQLNAESLTGLFGVRQRLSWIDQGSVVALGSDIHGTKTGYSDFTKAVKRLKDRADIVFHRTEELLESHKL